MQCRAVVSTNTHLQIAYRENTWGHRFVKMQVYDNCTDRLMCCTFTRCSSVIRGPGLMRV